MKVNPWLGTIFLTMIIIMNFCLFSSNKFTSLGEFGNMKIGKILTIVVSDEMVVDASYITKVKNKEINYNEPFFHMIDKNEFKNLIKYMNDNKLVIESGKYYINQAWTYEKIIEELKFKK